MTTFVKTCLSTQTFSHMTMHHLTNEERSFAILLFFKSSVEFNKALEKKGPPFQIKPAPKSQAFKIHSVHRNSEQAINHRKTIANLRCKRINTEPLEDNEYKEHSLTDESEQYSNQQQDKIDTAHNNDSQIPPANNFSTSAVPHKQPDKPKHKKSKTVHSGIINLKHRSRNVRCSICYCLKKLSLNKVYDSKSYIPTFYTPSTTKTIKYRLTYFIYRLHNIDLPLPKHYYFSSCLHPL
jgi:hypothetical protein